MASHTIEVDNACIKEEDTFKVSHIQNTFDLPVHTFPFLTFSECSFFAVVLGMAQKVLEEQAVVLNQKHEKQPETYEYIKERMKSVSLYLSKIEKEFYHHVSVLWKQHIQQKAFKEEQRHDFTKFCKKNTDQLSQGINGLMRCFGMVAIVETSALNYAWRNFCTASQHAVLMPF